MDTRTLVLSVAGVLSAAFVNPAVCQNSTDSSERVVEDTLVFKDPTVSAPGKWIFGAALEDTYEFAPITTFNVNGSLESGRINSSKPGISAFAGYGDLTGNYTFRKGNENLALSTDGISDTQANSVSENEITLRWRFSNLDGSWLIPYIYAGFVDIHVDTVDTITSPPGAYWASVGGVNRSPVGTSTTQWQGAMAGVGGIIPVSNKFGFRTDEGIISTRSTWESEFGPSSKGSGVGGRFTGTMYYNIAKGLNAQIGGRYEYLNGGSSGIARYRNGVFVMLGYVFK